MPAPSRRNGLSAAFVVALLAVILLAGFVLGPRAFEFSAWPQPSQGGGAVEEVVARSSEAATEVPVVRVRRGDRDSSRSRSRDGAVAVRGRNTRGDRIAARGVTLDARSRGRDATSTGTPRRGRDGGSDGSSETAPPVVVVVDETPAPAPDAPATDLPAGQPAQLAEQPPVEHVLRPDAEQLGSVPEQEQQPEADGLLDEVDHLIDSLLPGESRREHRGRRHGHR